MKVSVTQTGGPLGVPYRSELDSSSLSERDADELRKRTRAVTSEEPASQRLYPGELAYSVRIDRDDAAPVEASYLDSSMPDEVRALVSWVQDHPGTTPERG